MDVFFFCRGDLIRVRLGELDLQSVSDNANPQDFGISGKYVHPNYHPPSQYNDIALLKLDRQVQFSDYIAPICLQVNRNLPNANFIATGWGRTELGGSQSDILMKVDLEYFPNEVCQRNYDDVALESLSRGIVDDTQICAGSRQEEKDTCQVTTAHLLVTGYIDQPSNHTPNHYRVIPAGLSKSGMTLCTW